MATPAVEPEASASAAVEPEASASAAVEPEAPASTAVEPEAPASTAAEPEASASAAVEPEASASAAVEPEAPASAAAEPEASASAAVLQAAEPAIKDAPSSAPSEKRAIFPGSKSFAATPSATRSLIINGVEIHTSSTADLTPASAPADGSDLYSAIPPDLPATPRNVALFRAETWKEALLTPMFKAGAADFATDDIKHASLDERLRWRKMSLVRNATRRFRYTANLKKQMDPEMSAPLARLRVGASAVKAVARFKSVLPKIMENALKRARAEGFDISPKQLDQILEEQNANTLQADYGGVAGVAKLLCSDTVKGIPGDEADVARRQKIYGTNTYPEKPPKTFFEFVWDAMQDSTLWILGACAIASLVVGILTEGWHEGWYDGAGILLSILVVVLVTATSDYRQSLQFQMLDREKKKVEVYVVRGGVRQKVSIFHLVAGDVICLSTGDIVPADGILIGGHSLIVDESSMTGESQPCYKGQDAPFFLAGTKVQDGHGTMLATGVGMHTEWGHLMAKLSDSGDDETPLQVKLSGVATLIGRVGLYVAALVFVVLLGRLLTSISIWDWGFEHTLKVVDFFAVAVTIVVVAVPEGLPLAVTLSLAFAMKKMMADKALVRKLAACETMGSATTICSDKTGTLTANQMTVVRAWICEEEHLIEPETVKYLSLPKVARDELLDQIFLNTSGDVQKGEVTHGTPTESALLTLGLQMGGDFEALSARSGRGVEVLHVVPFSSSRKRMAAIVRFPDGVVRVYWKGAAEIVLTTCTRVVDKKGEVAELDSKEASEVVESFASAALRTLSLAYRTLEPSEVPEPDPKTKAWPEKAPVPDDNLVLQAIVGIKDPLRREVKGAISVCNRAGIKVRMVTGDNLKTAMAIAAESGILTEGGLAIEGPEFRTLTGDKLRETAEQLQVMARSSPSDKHLLVRTLRELGNVVAVTGDGTNDAPALKEAEIGLAMGIAGTEVAKESADVIVMDDNFSSIVNVAKWGRSVYTNIQKFVQFQLTVNIVALFTNFVSACFTGTAPLTAVQLLWVNLIMDTLGALALATEPPEDALMAVPPVGRKTPFISAVMWRNIFGQATFQLLLLTLIGYKGELLFGLPSEPSKHTTAVLNTALFNTFVFCQLFNEVNSREMQKINVFRGIHKNSIFLSILILSTLFQIAMVQYLGKLASTVPLSLGQFVTCVLLASISLPVAVVVKKIPTPRRPVWMRSLLSFRSANEVIGAPDGPGGKED